MPNTPPLAPALAIAVGLYAASLGLCALSARFVFKKKEWSRKTAHVLAALTALAFPLLFDSHWPVLVLAVGVSLVLFVLRLKRGFPALYDIGRRSWGEQTMCLGLYLAFLLAGRQPGLYTAVVLITAFADTAAAVAGRQWAARRHKETADESVAASKSGAATKSETAAKSGAATKSGAGSLAFFAVCALILVPWLVLDPDALFAHLGSIFDPSSALPLAIGLALAMALVLTVVEAVSPFGSDNLSIPLSLIGLAALARAWPLAFTIILPAAILAALPAVWLLSRRRPAPNTPSSPTLDAPKTPKGANNAKR